jgi:hypothetical protein
MMRPQADLIRQRLGQLVQGMTALRHDGRFDEPNLDGTAGDYISFDAWEWPQGVGLYGLVQLWLRHRDPALRRCWRGGMPGTGARPAGAEHQHHGADAGAGDALGADPRSALATRAGRVGDPPDDRGAAHRPKAGFSTTCPTR